MNVWFIDAKRTNTATQGAVCLLGGKGRGGETVEITRHNRGYVRLTGRRQKGFTKAAVLARVRCVLVSGPTKGKWRKILADDREDAR